MSCEDYTKYYFGEVTNNFDSQRRPLSSREREKKKGCYPYYGAQGIIDSLDEFIFDGQFLLIAEDGENLNSKKQNIAQLVEGRFWVNNHAHIVTNNQLSDIRYLYYYINNVDISGYITGSAQPKLNQANLNSISVLLPPLLQQKRIADILTSLDDKIKLNNQINTNLEQQAQAIFKSWFIDFEPFKDGELVESEIGMIPKEFSIGVMNELIVETIGGDWGKEEPSGNYKNEVLCIRGADIPEVTKGNSGKMPTRYIIDKSIATKQLIANDLVVEISGGSPTQSTGRVALITEHLLERYNKPIICTNFCRALKPKAEASFYLFYIWQYLYQQGIMFSYENGTTGIKNLDINGLINSELIAIPPIHHLEIFNRLINDISKIIFNIGLENKRLSEIRDSILPKLMSGEIEVYSMK